MKSCPMVSTLSLDLPWDRCRCDFRPLNPWKLQPLPTRAQLLSRLWVAVLQEVLHVLFKFVAIAAAGDVLDLSGWCFWATKNLQSKEVHCVFLHHPLQHVQQATESTRYTFPCWSSLPVAIFHEISSRLPPRDSQRSQELMLLIGTRRGINLCSNELGIPQRGRFRRAPWHIYCYCRSIPFATNFKSYAYIIHIYILYIVYDLYIYIFICINIRMHTYALYMRIHFSTKLL